VIYRPLCPDTLRVIYRPLCPDTLRVIYRPLCPDTLRVIYLGLPPPDPRPGASPVGTPINMMSRIFKLWLSRGRIGASEGEIFSRESLVASERFLDALMRHLAQSEYFTKNRN
jgi:hypothetical protein